MDGGIVLKQPITKIVKGQGGGGGKGGGGGAGRVAVEDPNTLKTNSLIRCLDIVSEGAIKGLVNAAQSIFFDATALQDPAGNFTFKGVTWDTRNGLPDQDYMAGFADAEATVVVNVEALFATPVTRTYAGPIDAARITISVPALTNQDSTTGDLHGSTVQVMLSKRVNGTSTWTDTNTITITGKCVSTFQTSVRIELGGLTDWDIKFARVTADSLVVNVQNHTWWATTTTIIDGKFIMPDSAYVGLQVDAQQFGSSVPTRSYDVYGIKCQVPSNYNPMTRVYTGLWDGTFTVGWTDNPAWVLYDLLTNVRYGLGKFISADQVDKWGLFTIAQYCDALVPNGYGGTEPRYTFNYQINAADDAYKVIQSVASSFRGICCWSTGTVFFVADMPSDPVKLVGPADTINGMFTYEDQGYSASHSVVLVTWFDPSDQCKPTIEVIEDKELIQLLGWKPITLSAYGCTSRGLAHRLGKWVLDNEKNTSETVSYDVSFDHLDVLPGMIVEIADPAYQGLRMSGRVKAVTSNTITVDDPDGFVVEAGQTYSIKVILPTGLIDSKVITNTEGTFQVLNLSTSFATQPLVGAMWIITASNLAPRQFRVMGITETSDEHYSISGVLHDPNKYSRVEQNIVLVDSPVSILKLARPDPPRGITFQEYLYKYSSVVRSAVTLSWTPPANSKQVVGYDVQYMRPFGNWTPIQPNNTVSADILGVDAGSYSFRVRSVGLGGLPSDWLQIDVTLFGLDAPPADVVNFQVHFSGTSGYLQWDQNTDLDISHYRIKFSPLLTGVTWSNSVDLLPRVTGSSAQVPAMLGTFLIKAVDASGVESTNATSSITTVASLAGFNAVAAVSDFPTWGGTKTHCQVSSGTLISSLDGSGNVYPTATYAFASTFDLGAVFTSRISAVLDADAANIDNLLSGWTTLAALADLDGTDASQWGITVELRFTQDDPAGSPTWSAWQTLVISDYTARAFQFRIQLFSFALRVQPVVNDLTITIDMPDRVDSDNNVAVGTGGITVTFAPPYKAIPAVGITGHDLATGDYWVYTSAPTATGFAGVFKNSSNAAVARTLDWLADGYGYGT